MRFFVSLALSITCLFCKPAIASVANPLAEFENLIQWYSGFQQTFVTSSSNLSHSVDVYAYNSAATTPFRLTGYAGPATLAAGSFVVGATVDAMRLYGPGTNLVGQDYHGFRASSLGEYSLVVTSSDPTPRPVALGILPKISWSDQGQGSSASVRIRDASYNYQFIYDCYNGSCGLYSGAAIGDDMFAQLMTNTLYTLTTNAQAGFSGNVFPGDTRKTTTGLDFYFGDVGGDVYSVVSGIYVTSVPEANQVAMLGAGLTMLGAVLARRRTARMKVVDQRH